jgi:hypothetical protein
MAVKRHRAADENTQLDLFSYRRTPDDNTDAIRVNGRETLAGIPSHNGQGNGKQGHSSGDVVGGGGKDEGRDVRFDNEVHAGGDDSAAGERSRVGNGERELHSAASGRNGAVVQLNTSNYRISDSDRVGDGSIKEKLRANIAAIRAIKEIQSENRAATPDEKSKLVRYVGWGGIPQIFNPTSDWQSEAEKLSSLLTEEEFQAARASTLNAHYTSGKVIRGMFAALERLGFENGRILEPACGIGHFIGFMPEKIHFQSRITAIELDPITAAIAKALYPDADVRPQPFEDAKLPADFFDLAISNVPFGDYKPYDPKLNGAGFLIHDYFFAAGLERVRPGGLLMFITSKGTMDKNDVTLRRHLAKRADLIGAIRLPNSAFKQNANTEVTTDIIILKKLLPGQKPNSPPWMELLPYSNSERETLEINEYFAERPQMMLGQMRLEGRMYQRNEPTLVSDGREISEALAEAIEQLPRGVYQPLRHEIPTPTTEQIIPAPGDVKPNAYTIHEDTIAIRQGDELKPLLNLPAQTTLRIRGMIQVRDAVRECLRAQLEDREEADVALARSQLN